MNVLYQLYVITTTKQQNKKIYSFTLRRVKKANLNSLYLVHQYNSATKKKLLDFLLLKK